MPIVTFLLLTLAVSLDGFGVGIMYGMRRIKVPLISIMIISLCSGLVIAASMYLGQFLLQAMTPEVAKRIGAFILIGIGVWAIVQLLLQKSNHVAPSKTENKRVFYFEIKRLGLVIQILRTPVKADMDRSGIISATEATLLGIALSFDAFGAGIGAALIGFSPLWTSLCIAISSGIFIVLGLKTGVIFANINWLRKVSILPGFILIVMGIMKLL